MRAPSSLLFFGALSIAAAAAAACSSAPGGSTDESYQTEEELAKHALQILGVQQIEGAKQMCNDCHDLNAKSLRTFGDQYKTFLDNINDPDKTAKQKVDGLRAEPGNPQAPYSPTQLGYFAATVHLVDRPEVAKLVTLFNEAFGAEQGPVEFKKFQRVTGMPMFAAAEERIGVADYEIVKEWVEKGMPKLDQLLPDVPRPTSCKQDISEDLKAHVLSMKTKGWAARNLEQAMPMFACTASNDPQTCFGQKKDDGTDIFPEVETIAFARTWKAAGTKLRMLHELPHGSSFWSRNSADGRFISSGGGNSGAFVVDLAKQLETKGAQRREIGVNASFDPSFMPDNSGLLIQGGFSENENSGEGTHFCTQDLFTNPATTNVTFSERQCSSLSNVNLYQSVGRRLADNQLSDYFIVNNSFESDDGFGKDPTPSFGNEQQIEIKVMVSLGTEGGFKIGQTGKLPAPFEGDTMMSPTTQLTASRIAGQDKQEGYSLRRLVSTMTASGFTFDAKPIGKICVPGGKANFSFDERYLVTHHYLTREDFDTDEAFEPFKDKNASDVYLVDLLTGENLRVTRMNPGQLALFPHFRSDGWLYITVRDRNSDKEYYIASDVALGRE